jgi:aminomethyltransferase
MQRQPTHLLVVNASNREKILTWIADHKSGFNVDVTDRTAEWAMIALQGPLAGKLFEDYSGSTLSGKKYYTAWGAKTPRGFAVISRTGYTGEDGIELMLPAEAAADAWNDLYDRGQSIGLIACGLGCRDTLRLEAAMPLYGHELSETIDPLTAGLQFAVKLEKPDFVGLAALKDIATKIKYHRVGLVLDGRRIAREHSTIQSGGKSIGEVTSGTFSPTLQKSLAMGYVELPFASPGTKLEIDVRGKAEAATVVDLPFYRRPKAAAL